jgi:hypothetical protein
MRPERACQIGVSGRRREARFQLEAIAGTDLTETPTRYPHPGETMGLLEEPLSGSDHVFAGVERIFAKRNGYFVVEKFGEAGVAAIELDPRRRTSRVAA